MEKKFRCRYGTGGWTRAWWVLTLEELGKALLAAAATTFALLGDVVTELNGMSIGGAMSSSAVATRFAYEESKAFVSAHHRSAGFDTLSRKQVDWLRYVDDTLGASSCLCGTCLVKFLSLLYTEPVSVVYNSDLQALEPCVWLNLVLYIRGGSVVWTLKNANREYLLGSPGSKFVPTFVP